MIFNRWWHGQRDWQILPNPFIGYVLHDLLSTTSFKYTNFQGKSWHLAKVQTFQSLKNGIN